MLKNGLKGILIINGEDFGEFDAFTGGELDAEETKYTPYDGVERTYLAFPKKGNVTVTRLYEEARDGDIARRSEQLHRQPFQFQPLDLDADGNYQQNRQPYVGRVKQFTYPEGDSNSNDTAMLAIELSVGRPGA